MPSIHNKPTEQHCGSNLHRRCRLISRFYTDSYTDLYHSCRHSSRNHYRCNQIHPNPRCTSFQIHSLLRVLSIPLHLCNLKKRKCSGQKFPPLCGHNQLSYFDFQVRDRLICFCIQAQRDWFSKLAPPSQTVREKIKPIATYTLPFSRVFACLCVFLWVFKSSTWDIPLIGCFECLGFV